MGYVIGIAAALGTALLGRMVGFERDRAYYPTILIVVATYYDIFAAIGGSSTAVMVEAILTLVFVALAVIGYKRNAWILVAGLAGHGLLDFVHSRLVDNAGVPSSWPAFCASYDIAIAAYLAFLLTRKHEFQPEAS